MKEAARHDVCCHPRKQQEESDREKKGKMGASLSFLSRKGLETFLCVCAKRRDASVGGEEGSWRREISGGKRGEKLGRWQSRTSA